MAYNLFKSSKTSDKWKEIGVKRRAGTAFPLFYLYSRKSTGIGEIPDLKILIDWCKKSRLSIIQLLPMNETGYDHSPYNSISTFALEPMYLRIYDLKNVDAKKYDSEIKKLKRKFPKNNLKVDYNIKDEKINLLWEIFQNEYNDGKEFENFRRKNSFWLKQYALYKVLKEVNRLKGFEEWQPKHKRADAKELKKIEAEYKDRILFFMWLQWQLYEQFMDVKKYAHSKKIFIMGDIPFLVSRDSADVWCFQKKKYFKMDKLSGAPPDMYFAKGQRWGMPVYNWEVIEKDRFKYLKERLKYAANFYDMYRIDHFVGLFRVWTIDKETPEEMGGLEGKFYPEEENKWQEQAEKILNAMLTENDMLPVAEDLGTVPDMSYKVLEDYGIPGTNVMRWMRNYSGNYDFINPFKYRRNSAAMISTHDSSTFCDWYENEAGKIDAENFIGICKNRGYSEQSIKRIIQIFFDESKSSDHKLCWKKEISNVYIMIGILNLQWHEAWNFIDIYLSSFGEKEKFLEMIGSDTENIELTPDVIRKTFEAIGYSSSIFTIQLLNEYLNLHEELFSNKELRESRINYPGLMSDSNWKLRMPFTLEKLKICGLHRTIKEINKKTERNGL
ncbi:MAG: 4-alpha-glucanotransferase [Bacteroidetes bacterium]|nr:4-alpha-glucanotransferase [Bacteroidota bacterium]